MDSRDYFIPREVAERLRVDRNIVMRWMRNGLLESEVTHEGKRVRHHIRSATLEEIERRHEHTPLVK